MARTDIEAYNFAVKTLEDGNVQGPREVYYTKNGLIYYGPHLIGTIGFATSTHYWTIMH